MWVYKLYLFALGTEKIVWQWQLLFLMHFFSFSMFLISIPLSTVTIIKITHKPRQVFLLLLLKSTISLALAFFFMIIVAVTSLCNPWKCICIYEILLVHQYVLSDVSHVLRMCSFFCTPASAWPSPHMSALIFHATRSPYWLAQILRPLWNLSLFPDIAHVICCLSQTRFGTQNKENAQPGIKSWQK